jgi:hypothetical protein
LYGRKRATDIAQVRQFRHVLELEPDYIKLDMSLTQSIDRDPRRRVLARGLIGLCAGANGGSGGERALEVVESVVLATGGFGDLGHGRVGLGGMPVLGGERLGCQFV